MSTPEQTPDTTEATQQTTGQTQEGLNGLDGGRAVELVRFSDRVWSEPWMGTFLDALSVMPVVAQAARQAHVARTTPYMARDRDAEFAAAWQDALERSYDLLEQNSWRWSTVGVEVTETRQERDAQGRVVKEVVTTRTDRNPQIAMMMLKSVRPKYRETSMVKHEGGVVVSGHVTHEHEVDRMPTRERMLELARIAQEIQADEAAIELEGTLVSEMDDEA